MINTRTSPAGARGRLGVLFWYNLRNANCNYLVMENVLSNAALNRCTALRAAKASGC